MVTMNADAWITCGTVALVMLLMLGNRISIDVAMVSGLVLLLLFRVVDVETALSGFSHPAVLMIASLFVVAAGLRRTGAIQSLAERLLGRPETVAVAQFRLMAPVALMSAFVNNTPIVAMYLPVIGEWARRIRVSPSKLFMPLSFAAILGGKITLIGSSSNIVVMGLYLRHLEQNYPSFQPSEILSPVKQFWGPAVLGLPTTIAGIAFVVVLSRWLLPSRKPTPQYVLDTRKYTVQMDIQGDSPIIGKSIEDAGLRHLPGLFVTEVERAAEVIPAPSRHFTLRAGDRLSFAGILESVVDLRQIRGLTPATDHGEDQQRAGRTDSGRGRRLTQFTACRAERTAFQIPHPIQCCDRRGSSQWRAD